MADSPGLTNWRSFFVRLGFELVVVFIGVYSAFALSAYEAVRESDDRRRQITVALVTEITDITRNTRNAATEADRMVTFYDSAIAASGKPMPTPIIDAVRVQNHMWETVLNSNGLDLLDVDLIYRLSEFYNELNAGFALLEQLRTLSETMLIPNLDQGSDAFYDAHGQLRPSYGWYLTGLRNLKAVAGRITAMGDSLVLELAPVEGSP